MCEGCAKKLRISVVVFWVHFFFINMRKGKCLMAMQILDEIFDFEDIDFGGDIEDLR